MRIWRSLILVALATASSQCRSTDPQNGAQTLADDDQPRLWYDSAGQEAPCDEPSKVCDSYKDEKDFVDVCVAKGFQAKTCGCVMRCSGKIDYAPTAVTATPAPAPGVAESACSADSLAFIHSTASTRQAGTSLDRCIESHVCNGNLGWCTGEDSQVSTKLRRIAKQNCANEVLGALCQPGAVDSFSCPERNVLSLSKTWADFFAKDSAVKRCLRGVICSDDRSSCKPDTLTQAQGVKAALNQGGCDYWLRAFCTF